MRRIKQIALSEGAPIIPMYFQGLEQAAEALLEDLEAVVTGLQVDL